MLKVAVLVSGGGTNLQAIIDAIDNKVITDTEIVAVISNNKNAFALERAKKVGIAAEVVAMSEARCITSESIDTTQSRLEMRFISSPSFILPYNAVTFG